MPIVNIWAMVPNVGERAHSGWGTA